jgi:hypothetical protein
MGKKKSSKKTHGFVSANYSDSSINKSLSYIDSSDDTKPEIVIISKKQKNKISRKYLSSWPIDNSISSHITHKPNLFRGQKLKLKIESWGPKRSFLFIV